MLICIAWDSVAHLRRHHPRKRMIQQTPPANAELSPARDDDDRYFFSGFFGPSTGGSDLM